MIYLDNSSTTKPLDDVCHIMEQSIREEWGNPSSIHELGHQIEKQIKTCRKELAEVLDCDMQEILFTSCGTESTNMALKGFWDAYPRAGKHMITSMGEHKATSETCRYLQTKGVEVDYALLNPDGTCDLDSLAGFIRPETSLISLIHVNNETGSILDVERLIGIRNRYCPTARIHLDCVQSFGKQKGRIGKLGVDYASISAHKFHGPKGIGLLYHKKNAKVSPLIHGGGQQQALRSGTENLPSIKGMTIAAIDAYKDIDACYRSAAGLAETLMSELKKWDVDFRRISPADGCPYIQNLAFPGLKAETFLHTLESKGVYVSTQSACSSRKNDISHVLLAMGIEPALAQTSIRISFDRFNTKEEMVVAAKIMKDAVTYLAPHKEKAGV